MIIIEQMFELVRKIIKCIEHGQKHEIKAIWNQIWFAAWWKPLRSESNRNMIIFGSSYPNPILPLWNFFMNGRDQTFTTSYMTQTPVFGTFLGNFEWVFLRKIHFCIHPFQPKNAISHAIKEEHWMHKQISSELFPKVYKLCCTSF